MVRNCVCWLCMCVYVYIYIYYIYIYIYIYIYYIYIIGLSMNTAWFEWLVTKLVSPTDFPEGTGWLNTWQNEQGLIKGWINLLVGSTTYLHFVINTKILINHSSNKKDTDVKVTMIGTLVFIEASTLETENLMENLQLQ